MYAPLYQSICRSLNLTKSTNRHNTSTSNTQVSPPWLSGQTKDEMKWEIVPPNHARVFHSPKTPLLASTGLLPIRRLSHLSILPIRLNPTPNLLKPDSYLKQQTQKPINEKSDDKFGENLPLVHQAPSLRDEIRVSYRIVWLAVRLRYLRQRSLQLFPQAAVRDQRRA